MIVLYFHLTRSIDVHFSVLDLLFELGLGSQLPLQLLELLDLAVLFVVDGRWLVGFRLSVLILLSS